MNQQEWLSPEQAAAYLGLQPGFLKAAHREGRLPGARLGHRTLRFRRADLDAFMIEQLAPSSDTVIAASLLTKPDA